MRLSPLSGNPISQTGSAAQGSMAVNHQTDKQKTGGKLLEESWQLAGRED
jgi:hypothetical protein